MAHIRDATSGQMLREKQWVLFPYDLYVLIKEVAGLDSQTLENCLLRIISFSR